MNSVGGSSLIPMKVRRCWVTAGLGTMSDSGLMEIQCFRSQNSLLRIMKCSSSCTRHSYHREAKSNVGSHGIADNTCFRSDVTFSYKFGINEALCLCVAEAVLLMSNALWINLASAQGQRLHCVCRLQQTRRFTF